MCQGTFLITASSVSAYSKKKKKKIINENTHTSILHSEKYLPAQLSLLYVALIGKGNLERCPCWKKRRRSKRRGTNCLKCVRECRELLMLLWGLHPVGMFVGKLNTSVELRLLLMFLFFFSFVFRLWTLLWYSFLRGAASLCACREKRLCLYWNSVCKEG